MTLIKGIEHAYTIAKNRGYLPKDFEYVFDQNHYDVYESIITGRDLDDKTKKPLPKFKGLFSVA
jgi:hypothetical protein